MPKNDSISCRQSSQNNCLFVCNVRAIIEPIERENTNSSSRYIRTLVDEIHPIESKYVFLLNNER